MKFTVVVPTQNRPETLAHALASVFAQSFGDFEAVVVDDGSDPAHRAGYDAVMQPYGARLRLFRLPPVRRGHGPAYARNFAVSQSAADYICFLDDDDVWTDRDFLARVARVIDAERRTVDLHFSDQAAYQGDRRLDRVIWIEGLPLVLPGNLQVQEGAYDVRVAQLMQCDGFCHLNTTVVRRAFFGWIGGFDENIRYESDRDFFLRAIDAATLIKYSPVVTAQHNVPVRENCCNVSTSMSDYGRYIFQMRLLDKAILFSRQKELRDYGKRHKNYTLKRIAEVLWRGKDYEAAVYYAQHAICAGFSVKWLLFYLWLWGHWTFRRLVPPGQNAATGRPDGRTLYYLGPEPG